MKNIEEVELLEEIFENPIIYKDWQKEIFRELREKPNIKKIWLINGARKTGATYFSKILTFFRKPCTTYVVSNNLLWSKNIKGRPIIFNEIFKSKYYGQDYMVPATLNIIEKHEQDNKQIFDFLTHDEENYKTKNECVYDNEFDIVKYRVLCSYDFSLLIINVSLKDLDKAHDYILEDFEKDDVLIKFIDNSLDEKWWNEMLENKDYFEGINSNINLYKNLKERYENKLLH